jgi:crossover junction endodeoxyribonuclease RuvC
VSTILGIDPGISGAAAFFRTEQPDRIGVFDMPAVAGDIDPHELLRLIEINKPDLAVIERSHPHPKEGVKSVWRYASAFTTACVVTKLAKVSLVMVSPAQWKRAMHLTSDKEQSRARALETFPVCAHHFARKKDHGRAEAALIALYGASHIKGHQDAH